MTVQDPQSIMRRKSIAQMDDEAEKSGLFKSLGLWQLTAIGVGGIIGIGIFTLAGLVASGQEGGEGAGPAVLISFLIAGLASAAAALSYAEFAGMIPRAGSAYTYGYVALGEFRLVHRLGSAARIHCHCCGRRHWHFRLFHRVHEWDRH